MNHSETEGNYSILYSSTSERPDRHKILSCGKECNELVTNLLINYLIVGPFLLLPHHTILQLDQLASQGRVTAHSFHLLLQSLDLVAHNCHQVECDLRSGVPDGYGIIRNKDRNIYMVIVVMVFLRLSERQNSQATYGNPTGINTELL